MCLGAPQVILLNGGGRAISVKSFNSGENVFSKYIESTRIVLVIECTRNYRLDGLDLFAVML
jgi:hypothetical protein